MKEHKHVCVHACLDYQLIFSTLDSTKQTVGSSDGVRCRTLDIVRLTSPNVPLILVRQDIMSESHLSGKVTF